MDGGKSGGGHTPQAAFEERLGEVVRERLIADSKSTAFFLECEALAHKVGSSRSVEISFSHFRENHLHKYTKIKKIC
jgi:hypothetical protein